MPVFPARFLRRIERRFRPPTGLMPKRRRSKLGPTRYVPRCVVKLNGKDRCWSPLPAGQHIGPCPSCREILAARGEVGQ